MTKITGIKSVDFKINASGAGVVNWNGSFGLYNKEINKTVNNHTLPKLRNVDPLRLKGLDDAQFKESILYVSQNCIRHYIFKTDTFGLKSVNEKNIDNVLCSIAGLVRGYVIAEGTTSLKRKSSLLLEDLVSVKVGEINFEQFSKSGERNSTSMHSAHTAGETSYTGYGSINIEDLQFIPLEDSLNRSAYQETVSEPQGLAIAQKLTNYLKSLDFEEKLAPEAIFANNYKRNGAISLEGEAGLLLNDDAISLVVSEILERLNNLYIQQGGGWLKTNELSVDYNTGSPMRIKEKGKSAINQEKNTSYAIYYEKQNCSAAEYAKKMDDIKNNKERQADKKQKEKEEKERYKAAKAALNNSSEPGQ